ncbi:RNA-binding S4 domain-containing protein [Leptothrix discophora]|uniref:RNA-binding S4 domain-containing protein n=1 Tax=Leptothrix discophora TaxID=89 RepID=A0ABT9FZ10_LEPDI|nr:RNA-binding S4 domain-containing protein [Leptothrix discophora]MDP4299267.1 RNA-binding S4 domain-containing protein [Leptothrix discophora]
MTTTTFAVRGDHITLDALLKVCGLVPSGGAAKVAIAAGEVEVDGSVETRKTRKLRPGAEVRYASECIRIVAGGDAATPG